MAIGMYRSTILLSAIVFAFLIEVLAKTSPAVLYLRGKIGLIVLVLIFLISVVAWRKLPHVISVFIVMTFVSCIPGMATISEPYGFYQLLLNFKFPITLVVAYAFCSRRFMETRLPEVMLAILFISMVLVLFEQFFIGFYTVVFPMSIVDSYVYGTYFRRSTGFFTDASSFGMFCIAALLYFYSFACWKGWRGIGGLGCMLAVFGLFMSGQRMEAASGVAGILLYQALIGWKRPWMILALAGLLVFVFSRFGVYISDMWEQAVGDYQYHESWSQYDPRLALLSGGGYLASTHFPFGSGLGTFGSSMSLINPNDAYAESGIDRLWWYRQEDTPYLTDSYWAMVLGELGWLGLAVSFASYMLLLTGVSLMAMTARNNFDVFKTRTAVFVMTYGLINSLSSNVFLGSMVFVYFQSILYVGAFIDTGENNKK